MTVTLYERHDPVTGRSTRIVTDSETGLPIIVRSQDVRPIVESAKAIASNYDPHVRREVTHVARIPAVIWAQLNRVGIAGDEKALNAWLQLPEAAAFRTDNRRRL